jgi:predicted ATPase
VTEDTAGDVIAALAADHPVSKARIDAYLSAIVQDARAVDAQRIGGYMTIALKSGIDGAEYEFDSLAMSDGTIRAVAVLAALFQPEALDGRLPLVGIEEPETALHPGAAGVLFDTLTEASEHVQVIVTSQSSDLLDREDLDVIRPVEMRDGLTYIGEVDDASQEIVPVDQVPLASIFDMKMARENALVRRDLPRHHLAPRGRLKSASSPGATG